MNRLDRALGISTLLATALLGFEATAFGGFGLFLGLLFHRGQGDFLRVNWFFYDHRRQPWPI